MTLKNASKIITNISDLENNFCPITNDNLCNELSKKNVIKLNCGHSFNYRAFLKSYTINNKNIYSYRRCPYCFSNIKNVPLIIKKSNLKLKSNIT